MLKRIIIAIIIILILISAIYYILFNKVSAHIVNTTYPETTQEQRIKDAKDIVIADVLENTETKYTNPNFDKKSKLNENEIATNQLVTYSKLKIKKSFKGNVKEGETVLIRELGGTDNQNIKTIHNGLMPLNNQKNVLIFLYEDDSDIKEEFTCYVLNNPVTSKYYYEEKTEDYVSFASSDIRINLKQIETTIMGLK